MYPQIINVSFKTNEIQFQSNKNMFGPLYNTSKSIVVIHKTVVIHTFNNPQVHMYHTVLPNPKLGFHCRLHHQQTSRLILLCTVFLFVSCPIPETTTIYRCFNYIHCSTLDNKSPLSASFEDWVSRDIFSRPGFSWPWRAEGEVLCVVPAHIDRDPWKCVGLRTRIHGDVDWSPGMILVMIVLCHDMRAGV